MHPLPNEHIIIQNLKKGDENALDEIMQNYSDFVFGLCHKITGNPEDAEEATQDTFVKVFNKIKTFRGDAKFSTWLYRIAYFTAINQVRGKKNTLPLNANPLLIATESSTEIVEKTDQSAYIEKAFSLLKPTDRALAVLYYMDEHDLSEIAAITGIRKNTIKVKLHRIKKRLQTALHHLLGEEVNHL